MFRLSFDLKSRILGEIVKTKRIQREIDLENKDFQPKKLILMGDYTIKRFPTETIQNLFELGETIKKYKMRDGDTVRVQNIGNNMESCYFCPDFTIRMGSDGKIEIFSSNTYRGKTKSR